MGRGGNIERGTLPAAAFGGVFDIWAPLYTVPARADFLMLLE
jgi:hypothetical protein